jgi:hypothetical protein
MGRHDANWPMNVVRLEAMQQLGRIQLWHTNVGENAFRESFPQMGQRAEKSEGGRVGLGIDASKPQQHGGGPANRLVIVDRVHRRS